MDGPAERDETGVPAPGRTRLRLPSGSALDLPVHPLLFAVYPILFLVAWNIQEIYLFQTVRSLLASLLLWTVVWAAVSVATRDVRSAALLTTLTIIAFFSYGHIYNGVEDLSLGSFNLGRHRYLVLTMASLLILGYVWILRNRGRHRAATRSANLLGLVLVVLSTVSIVAYLVRPEGSLDPTTTRIPRVRLAPADEAPPPDIIYIVLDSYARSDYMTNDIGFDNREFIDFLEAHGFYVAERSRANHNHTALSLSAALNMTPAQFLGVRMEKGIIRALRRADPNSVVRRAPEGIGYDTISLRLRLPPHGVPRCRRLLEPG
jgi:hypothetical protein